MTFTSICQTHSCRVTILEKAYEKKNLRSENLLFKTQVKKQAEVPTLIEVADLSFDDVPPDIGHLL